ncbi:MAG: thioredoxin family protein [Bacteroidia bacterium]
MIVACGSTQNLTDKAGTDEGWYINLETAKSEALRLNRPLFLLFTGSDWCAPCKRLEKEVLTQKAFRSFAKDNLVLVKMDFIRSGPQPSLEMQVHRDTVATHYLRRQAIGSYRVSSQ